MILSTKGRYAVMAMVDLAVQPQGSPVGLASVAQRQEIPLAYLEQIFARMKRAGVVKSVRGPGGGYKLARDAAQISIADIMLAADEPIKMTRCDEHSHHGCMATKSRCLTHDLWEGLTAQMRLYLGSITLADVCARRVQQKFPRAHAMPELMMFGKGMVRVEGQDTPS
ncbi:MAG: Rrf2 family transcriptional regulator [Alphaproteobacteria bacterium]|nr:Rrf2 family transcriptional regulator [Alphaproteobacteria bacterium]